MAWAERLRLALRPPIASQDGQEVSECRLQVSILADDLGEVDEMSAKMEIRKACLIDLFWRQSRAATGGLPIIAL